MFVIEIIFNGIIILIKILRIAKIIFADRLLLNLINSQNQF